MFAFERLDPSSMIIMNEAIDEETAIINYEQTTYFFGTRLEELATP
jgi:hypothetical protein